MLVMNEKGRPSPKTLAEISSPDRERTYSPEALQRLGGYLDLFSASTGSVAFLITTTTLSKPNIEARFHSIYADTPFETMHISGTLKKFEKRDLVNKKVLKKGGRVKSYYSLTQTGVEAIPVA